MPKTENHFETTFRGSFKAATSEDLEKLGISKASLLNDSRSLIPNSLDVEKNIDILPVIFNLAVVNKFNENGDGIQANDAVKILKQFIHKPINIEHRKDIIVGHIINASFSDKEPDYLENDPLDFIDRTDPFYISAAGVIYRHVYPELAKMLIEASDENSPYYKNYATSWEISFSDYEIAVGNEIVGNCTMYNKSDAKFDYLNGLLKVKGGDGFCADGQVNRLLKGNQYPLGCAITENPAADVSGIYTLLSLLQHEEKERDEDEDDSEESESNLNSTNNKNSVITENDVNQNEADSFYMTDEQYNKLEGLIKAAIDAKEGESQASAAVTQIREALTQSGNEWKSKAEVAEENASKAKADLETLKVELSNASQELENLKKDLSVKEAADRFNTRMSAIEGVYEFSEAQLQIVSSEVRSLDEKEESFASYLEKAKVLFAHCDKETIKANLELANASKDKGEEKEEKEDGELDTTDESKANLTNNNGGDSNEESLIERIRKNGLEIETK